MLSIVLNRAQRAALDKLKSELFKAHCSIAYIFLLFCSTAIEQ